MSGSVFLSGGWSIGSGINSIVSNDKGRRVRGAVSQRAGRRPHSSLDNAGGVFTTLAALVGSRTRFQQVDYRNFRELLNLSNSGRVHSWGRNTYVYDGRNRLVAIQRAARFDINGRCTPPSYFVRRPA
jgi:hypothetical protein